MARQTAKLESKREKREKEGRSLEGKGFRQKTSWSLDPKLLKSRVYEVACVGRSLVRSKRKYRRDERRIFFASSVYSANSKVKSLVAWTAVPDSIPVCMAGCWARWTEDEQNTTLAQQILQFKGLFLSHAWAGSEANTWLESETGFPDLSGGQNMQVFASWMVQSADFMRSAASNDYLCMH